MQGPLKPSAGTKGLNVSATIDDARLVLLNYELKNDGEVRLAFSDNSFTITRLVLTGTDTRLSLEGSVPASGRWSTRPSRIRSHGRTASG